MSRPDSWSITGLAVTSVGRLRRRYLLLGLILAISSAIAVFGGALGSYAATQSSSDSQATAQLRTISVYANRAIITDASVAAMKALPGVSDAVPFIRVVAGVPSTGEEVSLIGVTPTSAPSNIIKGSFGFAQGAGDNWVVMPASIDDSSFADLIGSTLDLTLTTAKNSETGVTHDVKFNVTGVADPAYQVDAVNAAYISLPLARQLYFDRLGLTSAKLDEAGGYERATLLVDSQEQVAPVVEELQRQGYQAVSRLQEVQSVPGVIALIRLASTVVTVGLLVLCVVAVALFGVALTRQRIKELGIMRSCGWSGKRVQSLWISEISLVAVLSTAIGAAAGLAAIAIVGDAVRNTLSDGNLGHLTLDVLWVAPPVAALLLATISTVAVTIGVAARRNITELMRSLA